MKSVMLPPLKPIPIKDRLSTLFLEKGNLDVLDGAFEFLATLIRLEMEKI